jgi:hypothetical protein
LDIEGVKKGQVVLRGGGCAVREAYRELGGEAGLNVRVEAGQTFTKLTKEGEFLIAHFRCVGFPLVLTEGGRVL